MKILTLLIAALALALYFSLPEQKHAELAVAAQVESQVPAPPPTPTPFIAIIPETTISDLVSLLGRVAEITPDGIIFSCEEWTPPANPWMYARMGASDGAGDIKRAAELVSSTDDAAFKKAYGELLTVKNGLLSRADLSPKKNVIGQVLLVAFPQSDFIKAGSRFRLVAAPVGTTHNGLPVYSAVYNFKGATLQIPARRMGY